MFYFFVQSVKSFSFKISLQQKQPYLILLRTWPVNRSMKQSSTIDKILSFRTISPKEDMESNCILIWWLAILSEIYCTRAISVIMQGWIIISSLDKMSHNVLQTFHCNILYGKHYICLKIHLLKSWTLSFKTWKFSKR